MFLNVKKTNFIIYSFCLLTGLVLIVIAIIVNHKAQNIIVDEILLSIGCSTIPTVVTAYLIDQASEKREAKKIKILRNHFMWGMPPGLLWIMRVIIERYSPEKDIKKKSLYKSFENSIICMKTKYFSDKNFQQQTIEVEKLFNSLDYGLSLCEDNCQPIIDHEFNLEINGIFSKDELIIIKNLHDDCKNIKGMCVLNEIGERIKIMVDSTINIIPELKEKANRTIEFKNGFFFNWYEITKD